MTILQWIGTAAMALLLLLILRIVWVYREIQQMRAATTSSSSNNKSALVFQTSVSSRKKSPCPTMVVLGSGGHTSEMLHMIRQLDEKFYHPLLYVVADTDQTSIQRLKATLPKAASLSSSSAAEDDNNKHIYIIPRSREVGQSYITSLGTTIYALMYAVGLVFRLRPQLLLCNGPGTCVPLVLAVWMWRILGFVHCPVVFCESYCRVQTLSLTGRILYPGVDLFLVHWESLHEKYPDSYRLSTFVVSTPTTTTTTTTTQTAVKQKHLKS